MASLVPIFQSGFFSSVVTVADVASVPLPARTTFLHPPHGTAHGTFHGTGAHLVQAEQAKAAAQAIVGEFITSLHAYPPRQKIGSFGLDKVMDQINNSKQN